MEKLRFGLIGKNIEYSFSKGYFTKKFKAAGLENHSYENFALSDINVFPDFIKQNPDLRGLNVTIPYKQTIIPFLDKLSKKATRIGAVNTIKFTKKGKLKGCNTDYYGFKKSLQPMLQPHHDHALILGTGGASKAIAFALDELKIIYTFVSRQATGNTISYDQINARSFDNYQIIINCTPVGTAPNVNDSPEIPYEYFTSRHIAFDLVYNPSLTTFLKKAQDHGAIIKNGLEMLELQAEKAWKIWT